MKTRSQIGRMSRRKGARGERDTVHALEAIFPPPRWRVQRRLQSRGDVGEPDVAVYHCDSPVPVVGVECKWGRKPNVRAALDQAEANRRNGMLSPVLIHDDGGREFWALADRDMRELLELYARDHDVIQPVDTIPVERRMP